MMKNILLMSDSLSGTGHQKRAEVLCSGLIERDYCVTYFSNQLHNMGLLDHEVFSFMEMPGYSNANGSAQSFIAVKLERMRKLINRERAGDFDAVIFEHFPIGKYYLLEEMKMIHRLYKTASTEFICVYRDIIDNLDMEDISTGVEILNEYFAALIVLSDEAYMPLPETFTAQVTIPITYLGYLDTRLANTILVFGGGGKFNYEFYSITLDVLGNHPALEKYDIKIYTGNLMSDAEFTSLRKHAPKHIKINRYSKNLYHQLRESFLTISTLGYNTFLDLLPLNNSNIIVPLTRNDEQMLRARLFERVKPNVAVVEIDEVYAQNLELTIDHVLDTRINVSGLTNFLDYMDSICARETNRCL